VIGQVVGIIGDADDMPQRYRSGGSISETDYYPRQMESAATLPAQAAPSSAAGAGALVQGTYACTIDGWQGFGAARTRTSRPVGSITLQSGGRYRWLDNDGGGSFAFDPASGSLRFATGPLADKLPRLATYRRDRTTTPIDIEFADGVEWSCGHNL
jgi:hypothetical protein